MQPHKSISTIRNQILAISVLTLTLLCLTCSSSWAATYYVAVANGNDENPGTLSKPWKTISIANSTLKSGDTVYIRGGTYSGQQIYPKNSGTLVNRIVYSSYGTETATIADSDTPINLSNRSYITVNKIKITNCDKYLTMTNGDYNHIEYCTFDSMRNYERSKGFYIGQNSSHNWVHHCTMSRYGKYSVDQDLGDLVYIGAPDPGDNSRNLVEDNHFFYGGHNVIVVNSRYNVIRNNYFHNEEWYNGYGNRIAEIRDDSNGNAGWNLFEGNRFGFSGLPNDANYSPGIQCTSHNNIIRRNMFYHCKGMGVNISTNKSQPAPLADNNYIFHNVFFYNGSGGDPNRGYGIRFQAHSVGGPIAGCVVKNNIFFNNLKGAIDYYGVGSITNNTVESNWQSGDPLFEDIKSFLDPSISEYPVFKLQLKSPCIDSAVFLTKTSSSGSGKTIHVLDAHFFMNGWGIIESDLIQLESQNQTARVINVDYDNNILTIDKSLAWSANQGVTLPYSGSVPDYGAFEKDISNYSNQSTAPKNLRVY